MKIKLVSISEVKPYEKNPRKNDKAVEKVAASIKEFGWKQPLVLDAEGFIIVGHTRFKAAQKLGIEKVPVLYATDLTPEQVQAYRLADNKTGEFAEWDFDLLAGELEQLQEFKFDMQEFGFEKAQEQEIIEDEFDADAKKWERTLEEITEVQTQAGYIWLMGKHRLMCGDSTSKSDIEMLMNGSKADMVFTDPPYKVETEGGCIGTVGQALRKQGKDIEFISDFNPDKFLKVLPGIFQRNKINAYIFCNKELLIDYLNWSRENKYSYNVLIWKKPSAIPIGDSHRPDIEYLLLFRKSAIWNNALKNVNYSRCLEYSRETGLHPTMKPIKLISNEIYISSNEGSIIVDCFGGSGSTLIAAEQTKRICYMMELDPKYCDVIVKRWEQFTGEKAVLLNERT